MPAGSSQRSQPGPESGLANHIPGAPASLVASRLLEMISGGAKPPVFVARSESSALAVWTALTAIAKDLEVVLFRPWDCLPYDRISPSREVMGLRMDALRVWLDGETDNRILVTSLDALLQRVPPADVIHEASYELATGAFFDRPRFEDFTARTGYLIDSVIDEPGEVALREDFVEIYPAGGDLPMRIVLDDDGTIDELRFYDPTTQRTIETVERMVFGPASELILKDAEAAAPGNDLAMEQRLRRHYEHLQPVLDILPPGPVILAQEVTDRLHVYLDIIAEAKSAQSMLAGINNGGGSLYLSKSEWSKSLRRHQTSDLSLPAGAGLPDFGGPQTRAAAAGGFASDQLKQKRRVLVTGRHRRLRRWLQRLEERLSLKAMQVGDWHEVSGAKPGCLLTGPFALEKGFLDQENDLVVIAAAEIFGLDQRPGTAAVPAPLLAEPELQIGDVVVHQDHGVGILHALEVVEVEGVPSDAARLEYHGGSSILVPMHDFGLLWRYGSAPEAVTLDRLHTDAWGKKRASVFREIQTSARQLVSYAKEREAQEAPRLLPDRVRYSRFVSRFPYAETADQTAAIQAVLDDLASGRRMNRLICGDVGFGKTEVALRAAAAAAVAGAQVAVLAPTTVLAKQHFLSFERRFQNTGIKVSLLSRLLAPSDAKAVRAEMAKGKSQIVIGTSALLSKDATFDNLGLLIIDEEHKFGARDKTKMRSLAPVLHVLAMSATPIPRTLQQALVGIQDVSLLNTPPARRRPVRTFLSPYDPAAMRTALMRERRRGGQSFVVVPRIEDIEPVRRELETVVPELSLKVAHGKMPATEVDDIMVGFGDGDGDVLLSTNIIESGLDVPRANTIFIWNADRFGLAQLHQLRGRVGRSRAQGIAYLLTTADAELAEQTKARLSALVANDRLGAGLALSQHDLDLRGTGDLLGDDQAGHVKVIGTSLYQRMLAAAVEGRGPKRIDLFESPDISIGIDGRLPEDYVPDPAVRMNLYSRLLKLTDAAGLDDLAEELDDRFGEMPPDVEILLRMARVTRAAQQLRIRRVQGGPAALAFSFAGKPPAKLLSTLRKHGPVETKDGRELLAVATENGLQRLELLEQILGLAHGQRKRCKAAASG